LRCRGVETEKREGERSRKEKRSRRAKGGSRKRICVKPRKRFIDPHEGKRILVLMLAAASGTDVKRMAHKGGKVHWLEIIYVKKVPSKKLARQRGDLLMVGCRDR